MIISYICGGLGNQMFQYAAGRRLAMHRGTEFKLDLSGYAGGFEARPTALSAFVRPIKLFELSISASIANQQELAALSDPFRNRSSYARVVRRVRRYVKKNFLWPKSHIVERQYRFEPRVLKLPDNVYLDGFWQSWKYFDDIAPTIRAEFEFKDPVISDFAQKYFGEMKADCSEAPIVSLHVRRGDLAHAVDNLNNVQLVHGRPIALDYILAAASRFDRATHFLVFSDTIKDIQWCREVIKADWLDPKRLHFSEGHTDLEDMALMTACDHHIIANSTFSWWSAWLDAKPTKRVIAPSVWSPQNSKSAMVVDDLIPAGWEMI